MEIPSYKPNSNKFKEEQREASQEKRAQVQKVVSGKVSVKKKSAIQKFVDGFIQEDASNLKDYVINDVIIPSAKRMVDDIISNGIHMILYGNTGSKRTSVPADKVSYIDYNKMSTNNRGNNGFTASQSTFNYDDVTFYSRGDAEAVLREMYATINEYGLVRVADFYEAAGVTEFNYTGNDYGWSDISSARVVPTRDGYCIKLPRPSPIK